MRFPWVNVALLGLLVIQLVTGFLGLVNGSEAWHWVLALHDAVGYAVLLLLGLKALIIIDVLNRRPRLNLSRVAFLVLGGLLVLILGTGLVWPLVGYASIAGYSLLTIHTLLAFALVVLFVWHTLARRFVFRSPSALDRRAFFRTAGMALAGVALWQFGEFAQDLARLPGSVRRFTGSFEIGSHSGRFPVVSWLLDAPAPVNVDTWKLIIDGEVERPLALTYAHVADIATDSIVETIDCTGGWYSTQRWQGVQVDRLLAMVLPKASAQSITVEAVSGYSRRLALNDARNCLLALSVAGQVLDHGHGFPLRLVAPGQRGFNWVKWITRIHVNDTDSFWQTPVPLQ